MKSLKWVSFALLLAVSLADAHADPIEETEGGENLERVRGAFRETYVNTEADFTRYHRLFLGDAYFDYRDVGPAPEQYTWNPRKHMSRSLFGISEEDRRKFEELVDEAFMKQLSKGKNYEIVDELGPNSIIMRGAVVDIVSRVPAEFVGRSEIYLANVGEATLVLEFVDGQTGEVLARIAERGVIGRNIDLMTAMPTSSVTVMADVRRWADDAARRLRSELDYAMGK